VRIQCATADRRSNPSAPLPSDRPVAGPIAPELVAGDAVGVIDPA
jgi:hypothetical protein